VSVRVASPELVEHARDLPEESRGALRDLILTLADCKRLLGIRYADFILCAPTLESGIAAASMAQDEWGHSRLSYALLSDFGEDPKALEHDREAGEYRACELLDTSVGSWAEMIVLGLVFDTALSVQYSSLADSRYAPIRTRVQKMLEEEQFHFQHAVSWTRRLARNDAGRAELATSLSRTLPVARRWFGTSGDVACEVLAAASLASGNPDHHRERLIASVSPLLQELGLAAPLGISRNASSWRHDRPPDWDDWDPLRRRGVAGGPDPDTLGRVRGDRNRAFLMD
jgi:ring-1,2-phenylacetyl-CoA epoxidase subunit PaaC